MSVIIPPIKCQGIKTKLIPDIEKKVPADFDIWIEPFMGSGVVGFNVKPRKAIFADINPHIIRFYNDMKNNVITYDKVKAYLLDANNNLCVKGEDYYKLVRARFNEQPNSLDFLFLNRSCFNGIMRFNGKGGFNVPFCKKTNRFAQAYITKIANQIKNTQSIIQNNDYEFICDSFENVIEKATEQDLIYVDPPYIDRYSDYYNSWNEACEELLFNKLKVTKSKFIMSSWHHNDYRENVYINQLWDVFKISTLEHKYFVGGKRERMNSIVEAIITNF